MTKLVHSRIDELTNSLPKIQDAILSFCKETLGADQIGFSDCRPVTRVRLTGLGAAILLR